MIQTYLFVNYLPEEPHYDRKQKQQIHKSSIERTRWLLLSKKVVIRTKVHSTKAN